MTENINSEDSQLRRPIGMTEVGDRSFDFLGPPPKGIRPEEARPIIEGRKLPTNIYRPEEFKSTENEAGE